MSTDRDAAKPIPLHPVTDGIPRRVALQALLGGVGAGFALPSTADAQHPIYQHLSNPAANEQAHLRAVSTAKSAAFLEDHQSRWLLALAEAIVPGSTDAKVGPFLDQLLAVESTENQRAFLGALGAFDMAAINK